jgi:predicted flap endonuclease-1-like 5' DNA nuclease
MAENWWIIVLAVLVVGLALWWLLGKPRDAVPPPVDTPAVTRDPVPPVPMPTATPVDVAPPPPAAEAAPAPAPKPEPAPPPVADGPPDNLLLLKGVGPKLVALLNSLGVTRFDQIAGWTAADIAAMDEKLGNFKGRAVRDQWVEQAGYLAKGDRAGFEAKFGKLEG